MQATSSQVATMSIFNAYQINVLLTMTVSFTTPVLLRLHDIGTNRLVVK